MNEITRFLQDEDGAAAVEYGLLVAPAVAPDADRAGAPGLPC